MMSGFGATCNAALLVTNVDKMCSKGATVNHKLMEIIEPGGVWRILQTMFYIALCLSTLILLLLML